MIGTFPLPYPFPNEIDFLIGRDRSPIVCYSSFNGDYRLYYTVLPAVILLSISLPLVHYYTVNVYNLSLPDCVYIT